MSKNNNAAAESTSKTTEMKVDWNSIWENVAQPLHEDEEKVPEGFRTARQLSEEMNRPVRTVDEFLSKEVKRGTFECRRFRVVKTGWAKLVKHYRPVLAALQNPGR